MRRAWSAMRRAHAAMVRNIEVTGVVLALFILTGGLLSAAPAHAATSDAPPAPVGRRVLPSGPAGSGVLGPWRGNPRFVSTACHDGPVGRRLLLLGDSLTSRWRDELQASLLAAGWWACIDTQAGRPTKGALDAYPGGFPADVDLIVMATGSNDIFDPAAMPAQVARAKALAAGRPLVWPTVYVDRWGSRYRAADLVNSRAVNAAIRTARPLAVEWYAFLTAKASRPSLYLSDGVHTNAAGNAARTALLLDLLSSCPQGGIHPKC